MVEDQQQRHYHQQNYSTSSSSSANGAPASFERTLEITRQMPADEQEILSAFEDVLKQMDLPPDKMRTLRNCDLKKKWDLVCDQRQYSTDCTTIEPNLYLEKLKLYMDKKALKKKKKLLAGESSTDILKHIEISLRTNTIDWVRLFLAPQTDGLQVLIEYITQLQDSFISIILNAEHDIVPSTSSTQPVTTTSLSPPITAPPVFIQFQAPQASQQFFSASGSSVSSLPGATMNASSYSTIARDDATKQRKFAAKTNGKTVSKQLVDHMEDDVHVGISCLRALLNNKFGITAVFANSQAIYCIVRSILHPSLRTKALAFDLLGGICALVDGHELVLNAFNRFRMEYGEAYRFQTLMHCFRNPSSNVDFLASCMKFVNVLVHSTGDMNQRVSLQYEFTFLGLDKYLEHLTNEFCESDFLLTHINLYWENCIYVEALQEKSVRCDEFEQECHALQSECSRQKEEFQVLQADCYVQIAQLNAQLKKLIEEKTDLERQKVSRDAKISTLTKDWKDKEVKYENERSELEKRISLLEQAKKEIQQSLKISQQDTATLKQNLQAQAARNAVEVQTKLPQNNQEKSNTIPAAPIPPPPPPPPPPLPTNILAKNKTNTIPVPPPPPPPLHISVAKNPLSTTTGVPPAPPMNNVAGVPPPPPPSALLLNINGVNRNAMPMQHEQPRKRIALTKNKLPMFNWSALNPNQVKGTIFNELNDEKLVDVLDLSKLEELFGGDANKPSLSARSEQSQQEDRLSTTDRVPSAAGHPSPNSLGSSGAGEKASVLGTKRLQNIAIIRRKLGKSTMEIMSAVHRFDLNVVASDQVEILLPICPTPDECTKLREYAMQHNNSFDGLTLEDQFLAELMSIERLVQKLMIMKFMGDFGDNIRLLVPQLQKVTAASKSLHDAKKFPRVIEMILAVGNAMNGTRRAPVYGFKLNSLDSLSILKSPKDRNITLLHIIAEQIAENFSNLLDFTTELKLAEGAATVNMETINADMRDIETKFAQALAEQNRKGPEESPNALNEFLSSASTQLDSLCGHFKLAQEAFNECVEYFGEVPGRIQPDAFFTRIVSFCKHFEQAHRENVARKAAEKRAQEVAQQKRHSTQLQQRRLGVGTNVKSPGQNQLLDELNVKFANALNGGATRNSTGDGHRNKLKSSKLDDGDFERIMNGLKEGFVASTTTPIPVATRRRKSPSPNREVLNSSRERSELVP